MQGLALARRALLSEPDNPDRLSTLGLAEVRNGMWDEAIGTLKKATALHAEREPEDFLFLAQAYQGRGDAADAGSNYERAVKLLGDVDTADPIDVSLWRETAAALVDPALLRRKSPRARAREPGDGDDRPSGTARGIRWVASSVSKQRIELVASHHGVGLQTVGSLIRGVSDSSCR